MFSSRLRATVFLCAIVFAEHVAVGQECEFKGSDVGQVRLEKSGHCCLSFLNNCVPQLILKCFDMMLLNLKESK